MSYFTVVDDDTTVVRIIGNNGGPCVDSYGVNNITDTEVSAPPGTPISQHENSSLVHIRLSRHSCVYAWKIVMWSCAHYACWVFGISCVALLIDAVFICPTAYVDKMSLWIVCSTGYMAMYVLWEIYLVYSAKPVYLLCSVVKHTNPSFNADAYAVLGLFISIGPFLTQLVCFPIKFSEYSRVLQFTVLAPACIAVLAGVTTVVVTCIATIGLALFQSVYTCANCVRSVHTECARDPDAKCCCV